MIDFSYDRKLTLIKYENIVSCTGLKISNNGYSIFYGVLIGYNEKIYMALGTGAISKINIITTFYC